MSIWVDSHLFNIIINISADGFYCYIFASLSSRIALQWSKGWNSSSVSYGVVVLSHSVPFYEMGWLVMGLPPGQSMRWRRPSVRCMPATYVAPYSIQREEEEEWGGRGGEGKGGWRGRKRRSMEEGSKGRKEGRRTLLETLNWTVRFLPSLYSFPAHHCPSLHMLADTRFLSFLPFAAFILV